jgi:transposase
MTDIEHETDIEKLRARAIELYLENEALQRRLAELIDRLGNATDPAEAAALRTEIAELKAQREKQAKKLFGKSSERRTPPPGAGPDAPKKPQTGHGPTPQPNLDVVTEVHKLDDTTCPECGGQMGEIPGEFEEHDEIDVEPRKPIIRRHKRQKYACQCRECVETAPGPTKLITGGRYSVRFAATVAVDKYDAVVPLVR